MSLVSEPKKHGGRREGAGRKPKPDQVTKVNRVPEARIPDIKALLKGFVAQRFEMQSAPN